MTSGDRRQRFGNQAAANVSESSAVLVGFILQRSFCEAINMGHDFTPHLNRRAV